MLEAINWLSLRSQLVGLQHDRGEAEQRETPTEGQDGRKLVAHEGGRGESPHSFDRNGGLEGRNEGEGTKQHRTGQHSVVLSEAKAEECWPAYRTVVRTRQLVAASSVDSSVRYCST